MISQFSKPKSKIQHPDYPPYPIHRPGPKQDGRQTQLSTDFNVKVFNFASKSQKSTIDWNKLIGIGVSDSLQSGVIFAETEKGSLVVKGYNNVAQGYFYSQLATVLGIPVPQKRIIRWEEQEYKWITKELQRATFMFKELHQKIVNRLERPFLEIQEYIPGISLAMMGTGRAAKIFNYYDPTSRHRLIKVGFVMGFDIFLNNPTRFPLELWHNSGNPEHMIARTDPKFTDTTRDLQDVDNLSFEFEYIYALDTYSFERQPSYYTKVEEFLNKLFLEMKSVMMAQLDPLYESKEEKIDCLNELKQMIYDHTLYEMKEMSLLQIMLGMILTFDNLIKLGINKLQLLIESVEVDDDWQGQWMKNLGGLNLEFMETMLQIFRKFCDIYQDVVKYSQDITLNQYQFDEELFYQIVMMNPRIKERIMQQREKDLLQENVVPLQDDEDEEEVLERDMNDEELDRKIQEVFMMEREDIPSQGDERSVKSQQSNLMLDQSNLQQQQQQQEFGGILAKKHVHQENQKK